MLLQLDITESQQVCTTQSLYTSSRHSTLLAGMQAWCCWFSRHAGVVIRHAQVESACSEAAMHRVLLLVNSKDC